MTETKREKSIRRAVARYLGLPVRLVAQMPEAEWQTVAVWVSRCRNGRRLKVVIREDRA